MLRYQDAITVTDTYHETKSRFAWIGEIENEQLLTALETLKTEDLEIITMYAYEGYDITEISKVYGVSRPTISIKIKRITKFLKKFQFRCYGIDLSRWLPSEGTISQAAPAAGQSVRPQGP